MLGNAERGISPEESGLNLRVVFYSTLLAVSVLAGSVFVNETYEAAKEGTLAAQNNNITVATNELGEATKNWAAGVVGILASVGLFLFGSSELKRDGSESI